MKKNYFQVYGNTVVCYLYDKQTGKTFKGVAVCQPEDTFDEELGKKIAKLKAIHKMQTYNAKCFGDLLEWAQTWATQIEDLKAEYSRWMSKSEHTYDRLMETLVPLLDKKVNKKDNNE